MPCRVEKSCFTFECIWSVSISVYREKFPAHTSIRVRPNTISIQLNCIRGPTVPPLFQRLSHSANRTIQSVSQCLVLVQHSVELIYVYILYVSINRLAVCRVIKKKIIFSKTELRSKETVAVPKLCAFGVF